MTLQTSDFTRRACIAAAVVLASAALAAQRPQPGTKLPLSQIEAQMFHVSAGKRLKPASWPNGARVAVCLSFDADTEAPLLRDGTTSPTALSAADFGAQSGVPRILAMLDRHQIPATFFVTAVDAMLHPDMIAAIQKSGRHEIGVHGWIHETPTRLTAVDEERLLDQAIDYLTKVTGKRPLGYRAPSWAFSAAFSALSRSTSACSPSSGIVALLASQDLTRRHRTRWCCAARS